MGAFIPALVSSALSAATGGLLASGVGSKRVDRTPKFQRELIDQILQGLQGQGPFAGLFQADEAAFQKSIADPLLQQFKTQTAPNIQQSFIASGQQRGTPLESSLARAGLDVQGQINQQFLDFQKGAQDRQFQGIKQALSFKPDIQQQLTPFGGVLRGLAGSGDVNALVKSLLQSLSGGGGTGNVLAGASVRSGAPAGVSTGTRRGFRPGV